MRRVAALLALAAMAACASGGALPNPASAAGPVETITVDRGYTAGVCVGACSDQRITVSSDGRIETIERMRGPVPTVRRWRVSPRVAARFFAALAVVRPSADRDFGEPCRAPEEDCVRAFSDVIDWSGPAGTVRLRANGPRPQRVYCALWFAMTRVGIDRLTAARIKPREPELGSSCEPERLESYER